MKTKFILLYCLFFAVMSIASARLLDSSSTNEMLSFIIYADTFYLIVSAICWLFIFILIESIDKYTYKFLAGFFAGLIVLNLFGLFVFDKLPTIELFISDKDTVGLNLGINLAYAFSFVIAFMLSFVYEREDGNPVVSTVDKK